MFDIKICKKTLAVWAQQCSVLMVILQGFLMILLEIVQQTCPWTTTGELGYPPASCLILMVILQGFSRFYLVIVQQATHWTIVLTCVFLILPTEN